MLLSPNAHLDIEFYFEKKYKFQFVIYIVIHFWFFLGIFDLERKKTLSNK